MGAGFQRLWPEPYTEAQAWSASPTCTIGTEQVSDTDTNRVEYRFALEFPLSALPDGATVTDVVLGLYGPTGFLEIHGYAGDGLITSADVDVAGPVSGVFNKDEVADRIGVESLLTPEMWASGWAGFSIRQVGAGADLSPVASYACPDDAIRGPMFRIFWIVPPLCDLAVAAEAGDWVDDTLNATVGDTTVIAGFDYPEDATVLLELASPGGASSVMSIPAFDESGTVETGVTWGYQTAVQWETGDEGTWNLLAYPEIDPTCSDTLVVVVTAAAATPVPATTPQGGGLPDTALSDDREDRGGLPITLLGAAAVTSTVMWLVRRHRISRPVDHDRPLGHGR
jgi:hypothetical protein